MISGQPSFFSVHGKRLRRWMIAGFSIEKEVRTYLDPLAVSCLVAAL
jgi:hypothetical protein